MSNTYEDLFNQSESEGLATAPLNTIKTNLNRIFDGDEWATWEPETISESLGIVFDDLTLDKILLLQTIIQNPLEILENITMFLHATDVINNKVSDFAYLPQPTMLEMAYSLFQIHEILGDLFETPAPDSDLAKAITYLLIQEGCSEPPPPFTFLDKSAFTEGQTPEDIEAKKIAITTYINHMESL